ncbi:MAG TPA: hypothetical protein VED16_00835 [Candidatus Acidoferrum sp.]|nr:hypothetical protein [Candidatus Acidoferrum sp.]
MLKKDKMQSMLKRLIIGIECVSGCHQITSDEKVTTLDQSRA